MPFILPIRLDYTAHMYSSKEKTSARGRQAKEYTPHPLWLVVPDQVSDSTCKRRQRDPEAMLRSGGGVPGGAPRDTGAKIPFILPIRPPFRIFALPLALPGLAVCGLLVWLLSWEEFTLATYLTLGAKTMPLQVYQDRSQCSSESAASLVVKGA